MRAVDPARKILLCAIPWLVAFLLAERAIGHEQMGPCTPIPLYAHGDIVDQVCREHPGEGRVVLDLGDEWAPRLFSETASAPQPYRSTFVALENERWGPGPEWARARADRYYELFGIFPSFSVVRARLLDARRHACHRASDDAPLRALPLDHAQSSGPDRVLAAAAISALQLHLACEGLLPAGARAGSLDARTTEALAQYRRRHMLPSAGPLDAETRDVLLTDSGELDYRTLLRSLRERVADAAGLIEDGSAANAWEPVLGRWLEPAEFRFPLRPRPLADAAPDTVARATEIAARALGWTGPDAAVRALAGGPPGVVALRLPWLSDGPLQQLQLRVEIDRGDVWTEYPFDARGRPRRSPVKNRPALVLLAQTPQGERPLLRWPTTIGAWQQEQLATSAVVRRYKHSPVGQFLWRDLLAAPAWFPPRSTPDSELVAWQPGAGWAADQDAVGPGYHSAYGLVAFLHHRVPADDGAAGELSDAQVRTHGSANYRSVLRASSHGCHRLFNHLAIRLASFVLAHAAHRRHGPSAESYRRTLHWSGRTLELQAATRGYRYELEAPISVTVLSGHEVRSSAGDQRPPVRPAPGLEPLAADTSGCN